MLPDTHHRHSCSRESVVREVLIAATDIIEPGTEPFVGWSAVLAERIVEALDKETA